MSMRNIAYIKPQDPKFLQQLKQEIGYKEGASVETKRQKLEDLEDNSSTEENIEREDEKPQVVVIKSGDLTAEEVAIEEKRLAKEIAEAPADLSKPIVFRKRHKPAEDLALETVTFSKECSKRAKKNHNKQTKSSDISLSKSSSKLSFNADEEDEYQ